jgi:hypothetical protein
MNEIKCPNCGEVHGDLWEYKLDQEETTEIECDCGVFINVTCNITVDYTAEIATFRNCIVCGDNYNNKDLLHCCYPMPKKIQVIDEDKRYFCNNCYCKLMGEEMKNKRRINKKSTFI